MRMLDSSSTIEIDLLVFKGFLSDTLWEPGKRVLGEDVGPARG